MNQCVPSWEIHDNHKLPVRSQPNSISVAPDVPTLDLDYEVAELTWENGHLAMHSLGPQRIPNKPQPPTKYTWDKPQGNGTLESIVNQVHHKPTSEDEPPWFNQHRANNNSPKPPSISGSASTSTSPAMTMDALVPNNNNNNKNNKNNNNNKKRIRGEEPSSSHVLDSGMFHKCDVACSTPVGSCSGVARVPHSWSSRDPSVSGSDTFGRDSRQVTLDTCEMELGVGGFTSASMGSPGNTSSGKQCTADDHDSVCHSRPQREEDDEGDKKKAKVKSSALIKRSRAAAIHNQSERKRRDKINQRMKTLQKLVPNSSKTDKASMLDEVIEYLKQLQNQIQMMSRMNMSPMMLPLAMQQQLQMSMMAPMMGMGMGMGVMDINSINGRPNMAGIQPVLHPTAFMPMGTSWESAGDRLPTAAANVMHDPLAAFLACQSQPITMDAYSRMVAMYQQMQQPHAPISKN